jgi:hypothetical protein
MRKALTVALAAVLVACGGGSSDGGDGGTPGAALTKAQFCEALATAIAGKLGTCLNASAAVVAEQKQDELVNCNDELRDGLGIPGTFRADLAPGCVQALAALSCSDFEALSSMPPACDGVFTGTVANGGGCALDAACVAGSYCEGSGDGAVACGTCRAMPTAGQPCGNGEDGFTCAAGLACDTSGTPPVCATAQAPGTAGQACAALSANGNPCAAGHYCDGGGTCRAKKTSGACALFSDECAVGHLCVGTGSTGTCVAVRQGGGSCTPGDVDECAWGWTCPPTGTSCVAAPTVGQSCADSRYCVNAWCDPRDGECKAFIAEGADCPLVSGFELVGGECGPNNFCASNGKCTKPVYVCQAP